MFATWLLEMKKGKRVLAFMLGLVLVGQFGTANLARADTPEFSDPATPYSLGQGEQNSGDAPNTGNAGNIAAASITPYGVGALATAGGILTITDDVIMYDDTSHPVADVTAIENSDSPLTIVLNNANPVTLTTIISEADITITGYGTLSVQNALWHGRAISLPYNATTWAISTLTITGGATLEANAYGEGGIGIYAFMVEITDGATVRAQGTDIGIRTCDEADLAGGPMGDSVAVSRASVLEALGGTAGIFTGAFTINSGIYAPPEVYACQVTVTGEKYGVLAATVQSEPDDYYSVFTVTGNETGIYAHTVTLCPRSNVYGDKYGIFTLRTGYGETDNLSAHINATPNYKELPDRGSASMGTPLWEDCDDSKWTIPTGETDGYGSPLYPDFMAAYMALELEYGVEGGQYGIVTGNFAPRSGGGPLGCYPAQVSGGLYGCYAENLGFYMTATAKFTGGKVGVYFYRSEFKEYSVLRAEGGDFGILSGQGFYSSTANYVEGSGSISGIVSGCDDKGNFLADDHSFVGATSSFMLIGRTDINSGRSAIDLPPAYLEQMRENNGSLSPVMYEYYYGVVEVDPDSFLALEQRYPHILAHQRRGIDPI